MSKDGLKYVVLYSENFDTQTWREYCLMTDAGFNSSTIKIYFDKSLVEVTTDVREVLRTEIKNASHILSNDYHEIEDIIFRLKQLEDKDIELEYSLDDIIVWEKRLGDFTVEEFLEEIS